MEVGNAKRSGAERRVGVGGAVALGCVVWCFRCVFVLFFFLPCALSALPPARGAQQAAAAAILASAPYLAGSPAPSLALPLALSEGSGAW